MADPVRHTHGQLIVGFYRSTPAFRAIAEHVVVMRAEDRGIVAMFGPTNTPTEEVSKADARIFAAGEALVDSLLAVEWAGTDRDEHGDEYDCCPNCGAALGSAHTPGCELRDSLDAALGVTSPRLEVAHG